ncbi:probable ribulose-1,5 bisphosphate carboxylase/oxygenase large subunit [Coccomyxa sp. Obi]|nr:probable ribulose-1,5 bisphosphate carboxylase/oxygenase large subunit [Coccomyxa sp. Obi]
MHRHGREFHSRKRLTRSQSSEQSSAFGADLQNFLSWLTANGVKGIGRDESKVALYTTESGERGLVCTKDVAKGESLLQIPLRLGIIDQAPDELGDDLLEVSRLALQLLDEVGMGESSQRYPWLQVTPEHVPSLYGCFPKDLYSDLQGSVPEIDLRKARHRAATEYTKIKDSGCLKTVTGDKFSWAISVVHSRAFSIPGRQGDNDISINMLMPLVDMLNHRGKECSFLFSDESEAEDNVRWDVVRPENSESGDWEMIVSATRAIEADEEAWLSYSTEPGSYFLLHYGFVPNRNQFEQVTLFESISEAVEWAIATCAPEGLPEGGKARREWASRTIQAAEDAAESACMEPQHVDAQDKADLVKFSAGSRLDDRLFAAWTSLAGGGDQGQWYATEALAKRCEELLSLPERTHLLEDLHILASSLPDEDGGYFPALEEHYTQAIRLLEEHNRVKTSVCERHVPRAMSYLELQAVKLRTFQKMLLWDALVQFHGSRRFVTP